MPAEPPKPLSWPLRSNELEGYIEECAQYAASLLGIPRDEGRVIRLYPENALRAPYALVHEPSRRFVRWVIAIKIVGPRQCEAADFQLKKLSKRDFANLVSLYLTPRSSDEQPD